MNYYKRNSKDRRYEYARIMLEAGKVTGFEQLFFIIPKTIVALDMGMKVDRFSECIADPTKFYIRQIFGMAQLMDVDPKMLLELVWHDINKSTAGL